MMSPDEYRKMQSRPRSKFGNYKTTIDNITFDSKAEANHYIELTYMVRAGLIANLELQPAFPLVVNDVKVATYKADFRYRDVETNTVIVEDVKGMKTPVYRLKKKLVKAIHDVDIVEVTA